MASKGRGVRCGVDVRGKEGQGMERHNASHRGRTPNACKGEAVEMDDPKAPTGRGAKSQGKGIEQGTRTKETREGKTGAWEARGARDPGGGDDDNERGRLLITVPG